MTADRSLTGLVEQAKERDTSALAVVKDGELVIDWVDGEERPIELMSCTKLVVAVVVGAVLGDRAVELLDVPVSEVVPGWERVAPSVTLSSLLTHTSGLTALPAYAVYRAEDTVAQAAELECDLTFVGRHAYNNSAVNLVGGLVREITGTTLSEAAADAVFGPLGWSEWKWDQDSVGNTYCFAGLKAAARDAARTVDLLVSDPANLLPAGWADAVLSRGMSCYAQPAWIRAEMTEEVLAEWADGGVDRALIDAVRPLVGRVSDFDLYFAELAGALQTAGLHAGEFGAQVAGAGLRRAQTTVGETVAYGHDGDGGQRLLILPELKASAARLRVIGEETERAGSAMWSSFPGAVSEALTAMAHPPTN